jgi:hypothetical protein
MAALTGPRLGKETTLKNVPLLMASGTKAWVDGIACLDTSAHVATPGAAGNANLIKVGEWLENVDNSLGTASTYVMTNLDVEIVVRWYDSVTGGNAVTAANLYGLCYLFSDHEVTSSASGNSTAGRVWMVDPVFGVAVEALSLIP